MIATIAFALMGVAAAIQIVFLFRDPRKPDPASHFALLAASVLLFIVLIDRSIRIEFVAVTGMFESLLFFSGMITLLTFGYRMQRKWEVLPLVLFGATIVSLIMMAIASSPIAPSEIKPPIPALQSYWLVLHVTMAFIGEAFFVVAFIASIYYLAVKNEERRKSLDRVTYTAIAIGYPIFTAGALIFGAIWAEAAWGAYWSWDPKETWALITWFVYTAYLHARLVRRFRGVVTAWLSLIGFAFTVFTFFGVNFLLSGLHSYA
jgi:ABC-type transport system involved in cytochrome c biogenesis permease subunit